MSTRQKAGFTLVELLVVIVIIGILATISIGTFQGYFAQARNAQREATVNSVATIIKTRNATAETTPYAYADTAALTAELTAGGLDTPTDGDRCYLYGYTTTGATEFFIAAADESNADTLIVDGTGAGIAAANGAASGATGVYALVNATDNCAGTSAAVTNYTLVKLP